MKHLMEYLEDNHAALTPTQELLIANWLAANKDMKAADLALGMQNHIKSRLYDKHTKNYGVR